MFIFSVAGHIEKIRDGQKTQTRRRLESNEIVVFDSGSKPVQSWCRLHNGRSIRELRNYNNRLIHRVGGIDAIVPKRGAQSVGTVRIVSIRIEARHEYACMSEEDAQAEGDYTPEQYAKVWNDLYGGRDLYRAVYEFEYLPPITDDLLREAHQRYTPLRNLELVFESGASK